MKKLLLPIIFFIFCQGVYAYDFDDWDDVDNAEEAFSNDVFVDSEDVLGTVFMEEEFLDGDLLKISVKAKNMMTPVLGIAFHINFEKEKLLFLKYEPGDFLERGGDPFYLVKNLPDEIIFGETLRRDDKFPLGEGTIMNLYFQILEWDKFNFTFENGIISTLDTVRQDIDKISWQNLLLDKKDNIRLAGSFENDAALMNSLQLNSNNSNFSMRNILPIFLILIIILLLFIMFFIKKKGNKRHIQSVNFK